MAETLQLSERVWYEAVNIVTFNAAAGSSSTTLTVPIASMSATKAPPFPVKRWTFRIAALRLSQPAHTVV